MTCKTVEDVSIADVKAASEVAATIANDINGLMEKWCLLAEAAAEHNSINPLPLIGATIMEAGIGVLILAHLPKETIEKAAWDLAKVYTDPSAMAQIASLSDENGEFAAHMHHILQTGTAKKVAH